MENTFIDEEDIPMVRQDEEDYDDYNTLDTSRAETSFIEHDATEPTSTLWLRQKVKRHKIKALYRHLSAKGNPDLIDLDRSRLTKDPKKGVTIFEFYNDDRWVPLTKQTGDFFAAKSLRDRFGGINAMKNFLGINTTSPSLERSISAATKLKSELPTDLQMESIPLTNLSSLAENIHVKKQETSQNTNLDMREVLGIDKTLQSIQGELLNNMSKLTNIDKRIERDTKKLEEVKNDPTYSDEQRQLYRDRLDDLNTEKQARLEILSQNRKDLQVQVARIKQTLEKFFDKDTSLAEICILFIEQGITIFSILTSPSITISTIVLAITGVFGGGGRWIGGSPSKDKGTLKKMVR